MKQLFSDLTDSLLGFTYEQIDTIFYYFPGASSDLTEQIHNHINDGCGFVQSHTHGDTGGWQNPTYTKWNVDTLRNTGKWPYILSMACGVGNFQGDSFAEHWLRATDATTGEPTGAVATYMTVTTGLNPTALKTFVHLQINEVFHTFGGLCFNGARYLLAMPKKRKDVFPHNSLR